MPVILDVAEPAKMRTPEELARAIRSDREPLKLLARIGIGALFAFARWSDFGCPHCGATFQKTYLPNEVRLGQGKRICTSCAGAFDDGSREWRQLSSDEKIRYILPTPIMGVIGGVIVCTTLAFFLAMLQSSADVNWTLCGWIAGVGAALVAFVAATRLPRIRRSMRRYSGQQS